MSKHLSAIVGFLLISIAAQALGPHELLLLVNKNSARSKQMANHYARMRQIPAQNIVQLDLPDFVLEASAEISSSDFGRLIWNPANAAVKQRGIGDHILAWAYSADFPVRVEGSPKLSIQGLTFTCNAVPDADLVNKGMYGSPLFAGPDEAGGPQAPSHSFDGFKGRLRENMPVPSMMLGLTGARGMDIESALKRLSRGLLSDRSAPRGAVYFVVHSDVRSKCREWQYPSAVQELSARGVASVITSDFPSGKTDVLGVLCGMSWANPDSVKTFLPGCMADHLTSFAGVLDFFDQTKLTDWLAAGATASAGTIAEPYAIWTKFPNARFFAHYASGCTMIESFFQSIRCPLQLLIVGDPLASPWAPKLSMILVQSDDGANPEKASFHAQIFPVTPSPEPDYRYLVDGRALNRPSAADLELNTAELSDGYHELRAVAYLQGAVRPQVFAMTGFNVNRKGRRVQFEGLNDKAQLDLFHPSRLTVSAMGKPDKLSIVCGEAILAERSATESVPLDIDPAVIGPGPNQLQAMAVYADGARVRSEPLPINVLRLNGAPEVRIVRQTNEQNRIIFIPEVSDPEKDPIGVDWFQAVTEAGKALPKSIRSGGEINGSSKEFVFTPSSNVFDTAYFPGFPLAQITEVTARVSFSPDSPLLKDQKAGFVFRRKDDRNFGYAGLCGEKSAWVIGDFVDGVMSSITTRGAFIKPNTEYRLSLRRITGGKIELRIDQEIALRANDENFGSGSLGILVAGKPAIFNELLISPPLPGIAERKGDAVILPVGVSDQPDILARVSDGRDVTWLAVCPSAGKP